MEKSEIKRDKKMNKPKSKLLTGLNSLKKQSQPASPEEVSAIIKQLEEELAKTDGLGLSGVQIGILKRVGIIRLKDYSLDLVNPKIIDKWGRIRFPKEGCLSLPGLRIDTARYNSIVIENDKDGERTQEKLNGLVAICVQHEIDHMNGQTILNRKYKRLR